MPKQTDKQMPIITDALTRCQKETTKQKIESDPENQEKNEPEDRFQKNGDQKIGSRTRKKRPDKSRQKVLFTPETLFLPESTVHAGGY